MIYKTIILLFGKQKGGKSTFKSIDPAELLVLSFLVCDLMHVNSQSFHWSSRLSVACVLYFTIW